MSDSGSLQNAAEQRTISTGGGDYAEGNIDKRVGVFAGGNLVVLADPALAQAALATVSGMPLDTLAVSGLPSALWAQLTNRQVRGFQARPRLPELFYIVDVPDDVPVTLFRSDPGRGLAPYMHPYAQGRAGVPDVQAALSEALLTSGGRLLVRGRSGIGKTREVAELARSWCLNGWTICVAKSAGDADAPDTRLDALAEFPPELASSRLLLIVDDLHLRTNRPDSYGAPYAERLDALIRSIENALIPGSLLVIAIVPAESRAQSLAAIDPQQPPWKRFSTYDLPEFSDAGLAGLLESLAAAAGVTLETATDRLVGLSDRRAATLANNVALARAHNRPLNAAGWQSTRGLTWEQWLLLARRTYPATDAVHAALGLLRSADLPTRAAYVGALSARVFGQPTEATLDGLVDMGMLLQHGDILSAVGEAPADMGAPSEAEWHMLAEILQASGVQPAGWQGEWESEWRDDLVALAGALIRAERDQHAEAVATFALAHGADTARAYQVRGAARFMQAQWQASEIDLTAAIERGLDDDLMYAMRGSVRNIMGDNTGVIADMDAAIARGNRMPFTYALRGWAFHNQGDAARAEEDISAAISLDGSNPFFFWVRSLIRQSRSDYAGAEQDSTTLLEQQFDVHAFRGMATAFKTSDVRAWQTIAEHSTHSQPSAAQDNGFLYMQRGWMRFMQHNYAGAEADLSIALERGIDTFLAGVAELHSVDLPGLAAFKQQWEHMQSQLHGHGLRNVLLYARAVAYACQNKLAEAEADLDSAIATQPDQADFYWLRALVDTARGKLVAAESDYGSAIAYGRTQAETYHKRGTVRLQLQHYADAEADLERAVDGGLADSSLWLMRAIARRALGKLAEAEYDISQAIEAGEQGATVYLLRAIVRAGLGQSEAAAHDFATAEARGTDDPSYLVTRAEYALEQSRPADAERDTTLVVERGEPAPHALKLRGMARLQQQHWAGAEADFSASLALAPAAEAFYLRGLARANLGDSQAAESDLSAGIEAGFGAPIAYAIRAAVRYALENLAEAEQDAGIAIANGYADPGLLQLRGQIRRRLDRYAEAEADFDAALAGGEQNAELYRERGRARFGLQRWEAAEADFDQAITMDEQDIVSRCLRGVARFYQGHFATAEADLAMAIEHGLDAPDILEQRALAQLAQGKLAQAEIHLDQLLAQHPDQASSHFWRATLYFTQGRWEAALAGYDAALDAGYQDETIFVERAQVLVRLKRLDEAEQACAVALARADATSGAGWATGELLLMRGEVARALEQFEQAARQERTRESYFALGLAQLLAGQYAAAQASYATGSELADDQAPWTHLRAAGDLEFWVSLQPERLVSGEARQALQAIQALLVRAGTNSDPGSPD